jgi:hypothetical protein
MTVYVLYIVHKDVAIDDYKLCGIFSELQLLENAKDKLGKIRGFDHSIYDFLVDKYVLNETLWLEGFFNPSIDSIRI